MTQLMKEKNVTKEMLIAGLKEAGVQEGMSLEVHSSLASFGHVDGGAETVIDALITCVGESGSIFMPAMRFSRPLSLTEEDRRMGITTKIRILPEEAPRTAMGVIADTFRRRRDVIMGSGVIRTAGWGCHAIEAARGGLDHVIHHGGKALLLGVDIYKLTAMHYVEDILPQEVTDLFAPTEEMSRKYPPEEWLIEAGEPPVKPWYTIQRMARERGLIKEGFIGNCRYMFFDVWDVVSIYRMELETNALKLYGLV